MDINGDHILSCTAETFPINSVEGQDDDGADAALTFLQHSIGKQYCVVHSIYLMACFLHK